MSTYRERREARADRLREWADKREAKSEALHAQAQTMAEAIPFGQPILVDHYSAGRDRRYRDRIVNTYERAFENSDKAQSMARRAGGITEQLASSIYSDDPDAVDALEARIASLEAERDAVKAFNVSARKGAADASLLTERQRSHYAEYVAQAKPFPSYVLQNIGGNITRNRQRLQDVQRRQARAQRAEQAGGVEVQRRENGWCVVTFADKPAREIIDALKAAGYRWGAGSWVGRVDALPEGVES